MKRYIKEVTAELTKRCRPPRRTQLLHSCGPGTSVPGFRIAAARLMHVSFDGPQWRNSSLRSSGRTRASAPTHTAEADSVYSTAAVAAHPCRALIWRRCAADACFIRWAAVAELHKTPTLPGQTSSAPEIPRLARESARHRDDRAGRFAAEPASGHFASVHLESSVRIPTDRSLDRDPTLYPGRNGPHLE